MALFPCSVSSYPRPTIHAPGLAVRSPFPESAAIRSAMVSILPMGGLLRSTKKTHGRSGLHEVVVRGIESRQHGLARQVDYFSFR